MPDDAEDRLSHLNDLLSQTITLLEDHRETHWAAWLITSQNELSSHDAHGLDRLLSAFGGVGSFNDLLVLGMNGHRVEPAQEAAVNSRLYDLRGEIWVEATALRREARGSDEL